MCQTHSTIGPGGDFTTLDAWVDAISNWAWSADGRCIAGTDLGNFVPPNYSNVQYWQLEPATPDDWHTGQDGTGAYGDSCTLNYLSIPVSITGIRWTGPVAVLVISTNPNTYLFDGCVGGDAWTFYASEGAGLAVILRNNISFGTRAGPAIYLRSDYGSAITATLESNTVYASNTAGTGLIVLELEWDNNGEPPLVATLTNNLVMDCGTTPGPVFVTTGQTESINITADSNIDNDPGPNAMPGTNRQYSTPVVEFRDRGSGADARLGPLAVSRHSGANLSSEFTFDALGNPRPQEAAWSRGAIEYFWIPEDATMGVLQGWEGKLYYCAAGVAGTPQWTLCNNCRDVSGPGERNEVDVTTRGSAGWKLAAGGLLEGPISFEMVYLPSDAAMLAIQAAFTGNTPIGMAWMNGPIDTVGSYGLVADMAVLKFQREEPLDGPMIVKVEVKPTLTATPPTWLTVAAPPGED